MVHMGATTLFEKCSPEINVFLSISLSMSMHQCVEEGYGKTDHLPIIVGAK